MCFQWMLVARYMVWIWWEVIKRRRKIRLNISMMTVTSPWCRSCSWYLLQYRKLEQTCEDMFQIDINSAIFGRNTVKVEQRKPGISYDWGDDDIVKVVNRDFRGQHISRQIGQCYVGWKFGSISSLTVRFRLYIKWWRVWCRRWEDVLVMYFDVDDCGEMFH